MSVTNTYMTEEDIAHEHNNVKIFTVKDLRMKSFFAKNRNYFI
jgi:hypothetical protein